MRKRLRRSARSPQALLQRNLSPERPIAILSGNDIEHALLGLAAMHVGIPYAPISVPYSLLSQDFGKLKTIIATLTPGFVFAANGDGIRARHRCGRAGRRRSRGHGEPAGRSAGNAVRDACRRAADTCGRRGACQGRARHRRQIPVHLGLDRPAEGRDQYPAYAVREPGDDPRGLCVFGRRAAGPGRLAAVEPHLWRQPRFRHGARQRRLVLYRRGQAAARRHRSHRAQSARHRADDLSQRAQGL